MMGKYFGTDGIRGIANEQLTPELAFKLGRVGGYVLTREAEKPKVLIGKDTRISGDMLEGALISGLLSMGIEVMRLGVIRSEERRVGKEGRTELWRYKEKRKTR